MTEQKEKLEFGGVPGNLAMIIGLPIFTAYLFFAVRFNDGAVLPGPNADWEGFRQAMMPTGRAATIYGTWFVFQALLQKYAPGREVLGADLPDGSRLPYRMNGLFSLLVTFIGVAVLHWSGVFSIGELYEQFGALISVMTIFVFIFSIYLYWYGKQHGQARHLSGKFIHDFWMGTGHNPRVPPGREGLDLKIFCEARPGLILWVLINTSFAYVQYEKYGFVSTSMILVWLFQMFYIVDYFWNEEAILTTMDIKHENFGYMLAFGDLVWVPMTYSLQAHYLIDRVHWLPWWGAVLIIVINMLGLYIFRAVNLQKHKFRGDPEHAKIWGKKAEYLQTEQGGKLLLSGFWGWSRHFNYVGDILMALSWSLPCLFGSALPYFYPIYFAILLIHRERRDHNFCSKKYGADWNRYCERVRYRIIPGIY
jgi:protein-S-isoprenylcysteine O-methyltransferase Ste14